MHARTDLLIGSAGPITFSDLRQRVCVWATGVIAFALLTALGARVAIPVPGTPVPITLQTLFVLLAGITLGPRLGTASMAFYLLLGMTGYHVFAWGNLGLATLLGPTGGYLLGFVVAQPVLGVLTRPHRSPLHLLSVVAALLVGSGIIFALGLAWLSVWMGAGLWQVLALGLLPFLPGLILKTAFATLIAPRLLRIVRPIFDAAD